MLKRGSCSFTKPGNMGVQVVRCFLFAVQHTIFHHGACFSLGHSVDVDSSFVQATVAAQCTLSKITFLITPTIVKMMLNSNQLIFFVVM